MNVIVSNAKEEQLTSLDIDVIKSISGEYEVDELVSMFKTFFYEKMIIDVTAIRNYHEGENDIGVLIVYEVTQSILSIVTQQFDTQELYDEIAECFTLYNTFIVANSLILSLILILS